MKKNFRKKVLKNGLTVVFEKRDVPLVSLAIATKVGGINEKESEKGISHFIEHLLYKGTHKRNAKDIAFEIEKNGGELNGFTSEEITAFWCKLPSDKAKIGLDILSDMVKDPLFDPKEIEKERKVIFEELKMRKDAPRIYVFDKILESLYEKPFGLDLIGTYESMNSITRGDLIKKWKETYSTDNLVLCCVGNYDFNKLVDFVEKTFQKSKSKVKKFKIKLKNKDSVEERKGLDQANLVFSTHGPLGNDKLNPAFYVLFSLMGDGMSSVLFSEIRQKRNLAYAIKSEVDSSKNYCYGSIYVGTNKENINEVKKIILEEFDKVSKNLSEKELNETKTQILGNHLLSLESSQSQMVNLLHYEISEGGAEKFYDFSNKIRSVKLNDVKKLASKIKGKNYSFFALVPKK
jgi:predicted Zn-dependent peptidase